MAGHHTIAPVRSQTSRLPKNYELLRQLVYKAGRGSHQTANDIFGKARALQPTIGLATVHRGLARLAEMGEIMRIQVAHGEAAWFEPAAPHHAHLLCGGCGTLVDIDYATAPRTLRAVAEREGVQIDGETLTFRGFCRSCA